MTGEELIHARITDTNSDHLIKGLGQHGMAVSQKITVGDDLQSISDALDYLSKTNDVVIVNGGLGVQHLMTKL